MITRGRVIAGVVALAAMIVPLAASAAAPSPNPGTPHLLASLPGGAASGSAIGPGGALFVPQPATGEIWRIDPRSGAETLYASGLPTRFLGLPFGGVMDVAFMGSTAYALVSVVGSSFPADLVSCHPGIGIYRIDGPTRATVVADIGAFACANPPPPTFPIVVPTGVQYALEPFRGGFLVTDGHHNRVLYATLDGNVSILQQFGDAVPTGLAVSGNTVYLAEAGPGPAPAAEREGCLVHSWSVDDNRRRGRCSPGRRRGAGSGAHVVRALAGPLHLPGPERLRERRRVPCRSEHRRSAPGDRERNVHDRRRRAQSAELARDHRHHGLRRHARR